MRLAQAWDEAAEGYEQYFVPRFAPWVADAVDAVAGELPSGPILVPCCGTFPELPALRAAEATPGLNVAFRSAEVLTMPAERSTPISSCSGSCGGSGQLGRRAAPRRGGCPWCSGRRGPRRPGRSPYSGRSPGADVRQNRPRGRTGSFARTMPPAELRGLRERFLAQAPDGEWSHAPRARHLVARLPN